MVTGFESPVPGPGSVSTIINSSTSTTILSHTSPNSFNNISNNINHNTSSSSSSINSHVSSNTIIKPPMSSNKQSTPPSSLSPNNCSLNISPKHERLNSLSQSRNINMKNLSLNLVGGSSGSVVGSGSNDLTEDDEIEVSFHTQQPPRLSRGKGLSLTIPTESTIEPGLKTPAIATTPQIPPQIRSMSSNNRDANSLELNQAKSTFSPFTVPRPIFHENPFQERFQPTQLQSPFILNHNIPRFDEQDRNKQQQQHIVENLAGLQITSKEPPSNDHDNITNSNKNRHDNRHNGILDNNIIKSTTKNISHDINNHNHKPNTHTNNNNMINNDSTSTTVQNLKHTITSSANINDNDNKTIHNKTQIISPAKNGLIHTRGNSKEKYIPEELQESSQLDAYPNGPANVLNGSIFLYSDPDPHLEVVQSAIIDINDFNLVINVANECNDLSAQFDTKGGKKEYIHIAWSHTSSILKELGSLVTKMAKYDDSDLNIKNPRKILVHCQCGVSRSACVVVGYFMFKFKIGVNEAYELLKSGTIDSSELFNQKIREMGYEINACDRICPNMSLIFELMEFGDTLTGKVSKLE